MVHDMELSDCLRSMAINEKQRSIGNITKLSRDTTGIHFTTIKDLIK